MPRRPSGAPRPPALRLLGAAAAACAAGRAAAAAASDRPVIGVFPTLATWTNSTDYYKSYQEWVEKFGASSLVLPTEGDVEWYFQRINALLIPGGPTIPVTNFARRLVQRAIEANAAGDYFPVWGTCLGFEWIVEVIGGLRALEVGRFDAVDLPDSIALSALPSALGSKSSHEGASINRGRLYRAANATVLRWIETENITYFDHKDGIDPERFARTAELSRDFDVVATSVDRRGKRYVAAIEGKTMPIYGVQYHPEKIRYVSNTQLPFRPLARTHIPKTTQAADGADVLAGFFVGEARRNGHRPPDLEAMSASSASLCSGEALCSCEELAAAGHVELRACRRLSPRPAVDHCLRHGPCRRRRDEGAPQVLLM